ncbi:hypothetical protein [Nocardioides sp. zg-DK7169]|uniref:hypothetical protein n=1 Tax=Nocardioides sp. zg-DK7169 TaxID=2736600 RepID=UPI001551ECBA|nr:hypothetical protein [Nocardioides sp. zg-DK7169]NPC98983.1 hypothetical protein [Nocardioides sp. zg-DK7169]
MYEDEKPCEVCGSPVRLRARRDVGAAEAASDGPVGPADGVVGAGDDPVDERVCQNPDCPTRTGGG